MITREQILTNARFAGETLRYHTWPTHQQQTVASHTWQLFRIYFQCFGSIAPATATYILWHDAGELVLGDLPFPIKSQSPPLKKLCDGIENLAVVKMGGKVVKLSVEEKRRIKETDLIEMLEFGLVEVQLGNSLAQPIVDDISHSIEELYQQLSDVDQAKVRRYVYASTTALGYPITCML